MASLTPHTGQLGRQDAAHLLRRASFGATRRQVDQFASKSAATAVANLLKTVPFSDNLPKDTATGNTWMNPKRTKDNNEESTLRRYTKVWWIDQMLQAPLSLQEKMALFHHTHFTTISEKADSSTALFYQIKLFRYYALGNFKELAKKICLDNAMLRFLDGQQNEEGRPNENFAREFLELYTIGKGPQRGDGDYTTYTEADVREAAKVFSGWKEDRKYTNIDATIGVAQIMAKGKSSNVAERHDASTKQFSAAFNNQTIAPTELSGDKATIVAAIDEIDQFVEMVFAQPATAEHICRKLYRFFVYYEITDVVEENVIKPLAQSFLSNNYELKPVLQTLFASQHFYDTDNGVVEDDNTGAIIKSPLDLTLGTMRFFQCALPRPEAGLEQYYDAYQSTFQLSLLGMNFYDPFEVAGYTAYHQAPTYHRNWISVNYLARRYEFAKRLISGIKDKDGNLLARLDVVAYVNDANNISDPFDARSLVRELTDYLLPEAISEERFDYFVNAILLDGLSEMNWTMEWQNYKGGGSDAGVRIQLENLFNTLLQSPEYQLS